jgi:hypothetical protein
VAPDRLDRAPRGPRSAEPRPPRRRRAAGSPGGVPAEWLAAAGNRALARAFTPGRRSIARSVMRGDPRQVRIAKDAPPPTTLALLVARLETLAEDAGIAPATITTGAVALFKGAVPKFVPPHPLHRLSHAELANHVLYDLSADAAKMSVRDFIGHVGASMVGRLIVANRGDELDVDAAQDIVAAQLNPYVAAAEIAEYTTAPNPHLSGAVGATVGNNPQNRDSLEVAAELHLAGANRPQLQELDGDAKRQLAAALEQMPVVQAMYADRLREGDEGGVHLKSLEVMPEAQQQAHFQKYAQLFIERATKGLSQFSSLVEPGRRPPEERTTTIEINPDEVTSRFLRSPLITSFRADSARQMDRVRLSIMDQAPTVVHEVGHQVEFALPIAEWLDIIDILQTRAGGRQMVDIYGNAKEIAFDAAMPAFEAIYGGQVPSAKYAAKIYPSGDTEVTSMSMEMFSQPDKARTLINEDPLLAATVLRNLRPQEFRNIVPPNLRALLPRGDV